MIGAGSVSTGAAVSVTVTWSEAEHLLPAGSVAVAVTVVVPRPKAVPDAGAQMAGRAPSTASLAVAEKVTGVPGPEASTVTSPDVATTGTVASVTVTVKLPAVSLPAASVAVQATVAVPMAKVAPGRDVQLTRNKWSVASAFNWSPDGRYIAYAMDNSIFVTDTRAGDTFGKSIRMTKRSGDERKPEAAGIVWSNRGDKIAFCRRIKYAGIGFPQIFILTLRRK